MTLRVRIEDDERLHDVVGGFGSAVFTRCGLEGELYVNADYVAGESIRADLLCVECDRLARTGVQRESVVRQARTIALRAADTWYCVHGYPEASDCPVVDCPDAVLPCPDLIGPLNVVKRPLRSTLNTAAKCTQTGLVVVHAEHTSCKSPLSAVPAPRLTVVKGQGTGSGCGTLEMASDGNVAGGLRLVGPDEGSVSAATTGGCSR